MHIDMDGILPALIVGFVIGLSGALAPGPTLVATIRSSLDRGWTAGPLVAVGHAAIEAIVALAIVAGLAAAADSSNASLNDRSRSALSATSTTRAPNSTSSR